MDVEPVSVTFDPVSPIILVQAEIVGPVRRVRVELGVDNGASAPPFDPDT